MRNSDPPEVFVEGPGEVVHVEITSRCNQDCPYCYIRKDEGEKDLDEQQLRRLLKALADWGVFQITFGGGEPFLREGVCDLARFADDNGLNVTVTTNGTLLYDRTTSPFTDEELSVFRQINISFHRQGVQSISSV